MKFNATSGAVVKTLQSVRVRGCVCVKGINAHQSKLNIVVLSLKVRCFHKYVKHEWGNFSEIMNQVT